MRRDDVVVVDHYDSYTGSLVHLVAGVAGRVPRVVQHDRVAFDDLAAHSHIVLSPGPGHPDRPVDFAIGRTVLRAAQVPVLGVCLGMQGLVTAFGGRVERHPPAHGVVEIIRHDGRGLFCGVPDGFRAVRYHSLATRTVPSVLEVTARAADGTVMAVRHRERPLVGVQFHPESILSEHGALLIRNFLDLA